MGVQELLHVLRGIADSLGVAIAEVVVRWTLDQDGVSACIIGTSIWQSHVNSDSFRQYFNVSRQIEKGVAIAEVVVRWTLDQDGVSACIIGTSSETK
jgi:aryl-alcohol dehydrogenase-like predicted oxidoreductase